MAIAVAFAGANIRKPGAYSETKVNLTGGFPLAPAGIVAIIGEASNGAPGSVEGVQTYTSEDISSLVSKYVSGPIVDAARVLVAPARDGRVPNGASIIRVYKTNVGTQATLALDNAAATDVFTITSKNYGDDQNLISVKVEAGGNPNARVFTIAKGDQQEVLSENPLDSWINIQYVGAGTACTLDIQGGTLGTTVTGGPGSEDLSISLSGKSVQDVVDLIDGFGGGAVYDASTTVKFPGAKSSSDLDPISTPADILTAAVDLYAAQKELLDIINIESTLVSAVAIADVEGYPAVVAKTFLSGGTLGASTNTNFQAGFDAFLSYRCNEVVPLISQDATDLASAGETDPASSFTVESVNVQALTHCITASNTKNRTERNCYVSVKDTFANAQEASLDLNHERASMLFQDVEVLNSEGNLVWLDPWAASCIVAGIQAGSPVGEPATFKGIAANGIRHQDYNDKTQIDLAIDAGLTPLEERDTGGFRVVVHNTTYGVDANFVYNRVHVLEAADYVAYNLRNQLEAIFVGTKARSGSAEAIKNTVIAIMTSFLNAEIIVGDDTNEGLGWKDLIVTITGNTATVEITITPVQGIDFILNKITLDNIRQTA